jgi:hypothetical protein
MVFIQNFFVVHLPHVGKKISKTHGKNNISKPTIASHPIP